MFCLFQPLGGGGAAVNSAPLFATQDIKCSDSQKFDSPKSKIGFHT